MSARSEYLCYTDGSCKAADGAPGGWGFHIKRPDGPPVEGHGKAVHTLAKIMEYLAVAKALAVLPHGASATVFSDNQSLIDNLARHLGTWASRGFVKVDPGIVDSVRSIHGSITDKRLTVQWHWLRSHNGNAGNERADALAAQGAREARAELKGDEAPRSRRR